MKTVHKKDKYKIVEIEWEDITFFKDSIHKEELKSLVLQKIKTIGYLIEKNKKYVVIAVSLEETSPYRFIDIYKIPFSNVLNLRLIK